MRVKLIAKTIVVDTIPGYVVHPEDENYPTDADDLAEQAGRLCYLAWFRKHFKTASNRGYLNNILTKRHYSVVEHSSATFYIDGVTRNFTHELIRHRHMSFSEVSQRYVDVESFDFVTHPGLRDLTAFSSLIVDGFDSAKKLYAGLVEHLMEAKGLDRKKARQAARHVMPGGTETRILISGNLRAWRELLSKRLSPEADAEICEVSVEILKELKQIAPNTFQDFE